MTLLNTINVGGTDYGITGAAVLGNCATPAGSEIKVCTFSDNFELKAGDMLLVKFTYANTYGDGSTTYPKLQVNDTNYVMRRADGNYLQSGEWGNNATLTFLFDGTDFILPAGSGTGNAGGIPLGAVLALHSNQVPDGYLPCNGVQFDPTQFAALYALLGDDHTPDLRECALVGIGQNATDTIIAHDVYTLGEFKDDQFQTHQHAYLEYDASYKVTYSGDSGNDYGIPINSRSYDANKQLKAGGTAVGRAGTTTHGKQKGVNYIIKATSGLPDSQQDYILNQLAPVDTVAVDNMHSVTSNAVANALPKVLKTTISVPFYADYSYRIEPSDLGLTTFANAIVQVSATAWENMVDISEQADDHITMRVWAITTTGNATVSLKSSGSVTMLVTVIYYE